MATLTRPVTRTSHRMNTDLDLGTYADIDLMLWRFYAMRLHPQPVATLLSRLRLAPSPAAAPHPRSCINYHLSSVGVAATTTLTRSRAGSASATAIDASTAAVMCESLRPAT